MAKVKNICKNCGAMELEKFSLKTLLKGVWEFTLFISFLAVVGFIFFGYLYPYIIERFFK